ncbi:PIN domain-containing protein [Rhodococcus sp. Z13]|uniref:PIN domain-containing protein n=1 Tax=Rhodococcus sacchari TaxID=2962047 RepID=A0ACD4DIN5_9NOCA|nr:PIN domain-containing protein [Rhodococcus sp. Z13]UYP19896.1 PIN domain-containing protein [Rhodococcus sp. Z13]
MPVRVVLGATMLSRPRLRDVALALAEDGLYQPYWSDGIIAEVDRRLPPELPRPTRDFLFAELDRAFPDARVVWPTTVLREVPHVTDPKETHIVSVALLSHADAVVTTDPAIAAALERSGIESWTPDAFVTFALDADPARTRASLLRMVRRRWLTPDERRDDPGDEGLLARLSDWARGSLGDSSADLLAPRRGDGSAPRRGDAVGGPE